MDPVPVPRPQYTTEQRQFIYSNYLKFKGRRGCYPKICKAFTDKFPDVRVPSQNYAYYIYTKQEAHSTFHSLSKKAHRKRVFTAQFKQEVLQFYLQYGPKEASVKFGVSKHLIYEWRRKAPEVEKFTDSPEKKNSIFLGQKVKRKSYDSFFKQKVISYALDHGVTETSKIFDINSCIIYKWKKEKAMMDDDEGDGLECGVEEHVLLLPEELTSECNVKEEDDPLSLIKTEDGLIDDIKMEVEELQTTSDNVEEDTIAVDPLVKNIIKEEIDVPPIIITEDFEDPGNFTTDKAEDDMVTSMEESRNSRPIIAVDPIVRNIIKEEIDVPPIIITENFEDPGKFTIDKAEDDIVTSMEESRNIDLGKSTIKDGTSKIFSNKVEADDSVSTFGEIEDLFYKSDSTEIKTEEKKKKNWTVHTKDLERKTEIVDFYLTWGANACSKKFNIPRSTIRNWALGFGFPRKNRMKSENLKSEAVEFAKREGVKKTLEKFDISRATLYTYAKKHSMGIENDEGGRWKKTVFHYKKNKKKRKSKKRLPNKSIGKVNE